MSDLPERGACDGSEGAESKDLPINTTTGKGDDETLSQDVSGACSKPIEGDNKSTGDAVVGKVSTKTQESSPGNNWSPNAEILEQIISMGISKDKAIPALYRTGNNSAEAAISWIFENTDDIGFGSGDVPALGALGSNEDYKMVFCVNCSLNMGVGKTAAQVAHAALGLQMHLLENDIIYGNQLTRWNETGETKVVLKAENASQLNMLVGKAQSLYLPHYLVTDAGRTQIPAGSVTVLSIFGRIDLVDQVTRSLKLL